MLQLHQPFTAFPVGKNLNINLLSVAICNSDRSEGGYVAQGMQISLGASWWRNPLGLGALCEADA